MMEILKEIEKMKINWKDFSIAFFLGLILFYMPYILGHFWIAIPMGMIALLQLYDPVSVFGLFTTCAIPLAFYLLRNRGRTLDSVRASILFGVVFLPACVLLFWFVVFVTTAHLRLDNLYSPDAHKFEPPYVLPTYFGLMYLLAISLGFSITSCLVILIIMPWIKRYLIGKPIKEKPQDSKPKSP